MKGQIFTFVLTYGGAAAALVSPFHGLLVYIAFAIIKPEAMWFWSVEPGHYSRIVALALLVGWALHGFGNWSLGRARLVVGALVGLLAWAALGAMHAPDEELAWGFVEALAKIVLPVVVGITTIDSVAKLKQLAWVIVLSQGFVAYELNFTYYLGYSRVQDIGFAGLDNNSVAIAMVSCVGLAFFLGLHAPGWWCKAIALTAAALLAHAVLITFSRGGMLALVAVGLVSFLLVPKRPRHTVALIIALVIVFRLAGPEVRSRFLSSFDADQRDRAAQTRIELWVACWDTMLKRPALGVGPDHWPRVAQEYGWPAGKEAHSLWLQTGAELGFPGLLFLAGYYGLCVAFLWPLTRARRTVPDPWLRHLARMVIPSLVGFAVAAQFVSLEALEVPYYIALLGAGVLKVQTLIGKEFAFEAYDPELLRRPADLLPA
jgi:probable O-glycosylation ligase (exosortase A-associated)